MLSSGWNRWRQVCSAVSAAVVFSTAVLIAPAASALGLGEIETRSALNERFAAEIELLDTRGLDSSEVLASLASTDDFRRVGVERFFFLTSLQFEVVRNDRGNLLIKATSQQPITEPYLNFLVEVLWPSGRLLKEYTVLLDPPTFTHSAAAPVAAPSRQTTDIASAGRVERNQPAPATSAPGRSVEPAAPSSQARVRTPAPRPTANDGTYGRTTRSDTMWTIATETLPSSDVTPQQNMMAIQRLNPEAFIDGNVNLLKAGVVLRLPEESDVRAIDNAAAIAEIDQQNKAWRSGVPLRAASRPADVAEANSSQTSAAPVDATSRGPGSAETSTQTADGRLRIVAADASGVIDGVDNAGTSEAQTVVSGDSAAQERIESLAREVDQLTYQLDLQKRGVEEQISAREKQINLKDQQIAQLQEQLKKLRETASTGQPQDQSTPTQSQPDATPLWQQPVVLGSVLGGLALLLAFTLLKRRRQNAADELELDGIEPSEPSFELADTQSTSVATPLADSDLVGDLSDADDALDSAGELDSGFDTGTSAVADADQLTDDELFGPADDAPVAAAAAGDAPQTSDVIGEADIYIAYGRYPQAIALLQGAVESNPSDHAVRMRLLEVSAETKDAESYAEQASLLRRYCDDGDTLAAADALYTSLDDDFRAQIDGLAHDTAEESGLLDDFSAAGAAGAAAVAAGAASVLADDDVADAIDDAADASSEPEPFAFDTTVTDNMDSPEDSLADDADALLTGEFGLDSGEGDASLDEISFEAETASDALDQLSEVADDEFELDLDDNFDAAEFGDVDAPDSDDLEFEVPAVNTDQFSTNVDMDAATPDPVDEDDLGITAAAEVEDFELDLDLETDASEAFVAEAADSGLDSELGDALGGDLGLDFPDETSELERVVAETDDDQLLDEIERSLDELEADGLLTPELDEEGEFSFDDDADTSATKLDLARAYIDMGDDDGAREILGEVISEGDSGQQGEASELLNKL